VVFAKFLIHAIIMSNAYKLKVKIMYNVIPIWSPRMGKFKSELVVFALMAVGVVAGAVLVIESVRMYDDVTSSISSQLQEKGNDSTGDAKSRTVMPSSDGGEFQMTMRVKQATAYERDGKTIIGIDYEVMNGGADQAYPMFRMSCSLTGSPADELGGDDGLGNISDDAIAPGESMESTASFVLSKGDEGNGKVPSSVTLRVTSMYGGTMSVDIDVPSIA